MDIDVIIFLILAFIVLVCFTVFMVLSYSGLFVEPHVRTGEPPWSTKSTTIVYKFLKGPYNSNDIGATFTEITSIALKGLCVGIFYDDPHTVHPERLRSVIGCVVKENEGQGDEKLLVDKAEMKLFIEKGFKTHKLPEIDMAVLSEFPYTTPFSIWLAPNRVYPRMNDYISTRSLCAYPMVEMYKDCKILYAAPLSKQEAFFVPECSVEEKPSVAGDGQEVVDENGRRVSTVETDESPNLRTSERFTLLGGVGVAKQQPPDTVEREISTLSSMEANFDGEKENSTPPALDDGAPSNGRSSRSGSNSSSFEEIGSDDIVVSSKKDN